MQRLPRIAANGPRVYHDEMRFSGTGLSTIFRRYPTVGVAYLFGSRARQDNVESSDYDFAIYFAGGSVVSRHKLTLALAADLSAHLRTDAVDVVALNDVESVVLRYQVVSEGVVLFEREPHRVIFEPKVLNEYFDYQSWLERSGRDRRAV